MIRLTAMSAIALVLCAGCRQPMGNQPLVGNSLSYPGGTQIASQPNHPQMSELASQVENLNSRIANFNSDNDNLHTQVAALQQRLQNANNYNDQLKQQLSDSIVQLQRQQAEKQQMAQNQSALMQSASYSGRATVRANNSLMDRIQSVQLPGLKSWMDGDVIRIEAPTDRLFIPRTYQINSNDALTLGNLANTIRQHFPRQVVGVEAHWDGTAIEPASISHHQLTATQALAVFDLLVKSGLSRDQVFTMAMGSNRPRYNVAAQNGISPNRRIEIVIYPETFN